MKSGGVSPPAWCPCATDTSTAAIGSALSPKRQGRNTPPPFQLNGTRLRWDTLGGVSLSVTKVAQVEPNVGRVLAPTARPSCATHSGTSPP